LRYDRAGEEHYNLISALHKSIRNSDPDAALYWLARMLEGGEDPRYIARRLVRIASEDVGLADPGGMQQAVAAWRAVEAIGMPECDLALAQAAVYLASAPKSNALYTGMERAVRDVREHPAAEVPLHLMECLPPSLSGRSYFRPTGRGYERRIAARLAEWRKRITEKAGKEGGGSA